MRWRFDLHDLVKTILVLWWFVILYDGFYCINVGFLPSILIPGILHGYSKQVNLSAIAIVYSVLFINDVREAAANSVFKKHIMAFYCILVFDIVMTFIYYGGSMSIATMIKYNSVYLCLLSYFMLVDYIGLPFGFRRLLYYVLVFSAVMSVLVLVATYVCNTMGNVILPYSGMNPYHVRNGTVRFTPPSEAMIIGYTVSLGLSFSQRIKEDRRLYILSLFTMIVTFCVTIYAIQTRALIAGFLIMLGSVGLFVGSKKKFAKRIFSGLIIVGIAFYIVSDIIIETLQNSLSFDLGEVSYTSRIGGYIYYMGKIIENPFIGIGRVNATTSLGKQLLTDSGKTSYVDVGIVGGMAVFGVSILIWYIMLMKKTFTRKHNNMGLSFALMTLMVVTLSTFFLMVEGVVIVVPLLLSMVDLEEVNAGEE
jgi:hypothetical protein